MKVAINPYYKKIFIFQLFLAAATIPFFRQHPTTILLLAIALLLLPWLTLALREVTHNLIKISLVFFSLAIVLNSYGTLRGLEPGLSLLLLVSILKGSELSTKRDQFIFLMMSVLCLVGHLLNVDQLIYVLYILIMAVWMVRLFFSIQAYDETNKVSLAWSRKKTRDMIFIFVIAIPQALFLFLFFPRFYVGNLAFSSGNSVSKVGFIDELNPGDWSKTIEDKTPIFRAKFIDGRPSRGGLYWRGAVLQKTHGFRWVIGDVPDEPERWGHYIGMGDVTRRYQVDFDSSVNNRLFTLPFTTQLDLKSQGKLLYMAGELFQVLTNHSVAPRYEAAISSPWLDLKLSKREKEKYLELPDISNRLSRFATEFQERFETPRELVDGLLAHYRELPFIYTLDPGSYSSRYPEDEFFFQRRRGFCEHYSSVTALLLRLWGIPSRIVTGFQGGVYNPVGDYFVLRGEDAHAWVEAYIEGEGWALVDPIRSIAPWRIEYGAQAFFSQQFSSDDQFDADFDLNPSIWRRTLFTIDSYYYRANLFFTSYREEGQRSFMELIGLSGYSPVRMLTLGGLVFVGFYLLSLLFYLPRSPKFAPFEKDFKLLKETMAKLGLEKSPGQSAGHYFSMVQDKLPKALQKDFAQLVQDYEHLKYSNQERAIAHGREFKKSVRLFIKQLTRQG
jgi:protein-glutamine gamma-glutamyltransferase